MSLHSPVARRVRLRGEGHSTEDPRSLLPDDDENLRVRRRMRFRILGHRVYTGGSLDIHRVVSRVPDDRLELENRREDNQREYLYTRRGRTDIKDHSRRAHCRWPTREDLRTIVHVGIGRRWESCHCER